MYNNLFVTHFETLGQNVVRKNGGLRSGLGDELVFEILPPKPKPNVELKV